jgi:peptidoglycan-associated lipoprotein
MMRGSFVRALTVAGLVLALAGLGCQSTPDPAEEKPDTGSEWNEAPGSGADGSRGVQPPLTDLQTVYFAYNRSDIRSDAQGALKANAGTIGGMSDAVTIEGHCDERGSTEYNLALGERRAAAVKRYLVDLGVPSSKLRTVSFGEDRPAVQGHDESAWRYNRRADFSTN